MYVMGTGEKKMKQSILIIALFLLLYSYYNTQQSDYSRQSNDAEKKTDTLYYSIDNKVRNGEILYNSIMFDEIENVNFN